MEKRELLHYKWEYLGNSKIKLTDKRNQIEFILPLVYADSLSRALIAFKNASRIELMGKAQEKSRLRIKKLMEQVKLEREKRKNKGYVQKGLFESDEKDTTSRAY